MNKYLFALFGTFVEYYDYTLYGLMSTSLSKVFFPDDSEYYSILKTYGAFAAGYLAKPLGAIFFSNLGDKSGRKKALSWTVIGITFPTLLIGSLPSGYYLSSFALICCRLMQGFFVGGEYDGVSIYAQEHSKNVGRAYAFVRMSALCGALFAVFMSRSENWRFPFLLGGCMGIFVFLVRRSLYETPPFIEDTSHTTTKNLFKDNARKIISTFFVCGSIGGTQQFYTLYLKHHFEFVYKMDKSSLFSYQIYGSLMMITGSYFAGYLVDILGLRKAFRYGLCISAISALSIFSADMLGGITKNVYCLASFGIVFLHITGYTYVSAMYKSKSAYRGVCIAHAFSSMIFSGLTPLTSIIMQNKINCGFLVLFGLIFVALIGFYNSRNSELYEKQKEFNDDKDSDKDVVVL
jgi:MFS transporter, MHS family, proline/betaine transporter